MMDGAKATVHSEQVFADAKELLKTMIRNACVNDGTNCNEEKNIAVVESYLKKRGIESQRYEMTKGRPNLLASFGTEGTTVMFGPSHVDVVPAENASDWRQDPFCGEEIKDEETGAVEIWGRGAIDMLQTVAIQTALFAALAKDQSFCAELEAKGGMLKLGIVCDEEAGGAHGAGFVCRAHWGAWRADYTLGEVGGAVLPGTTKYLMGMGEKGMLGITVVAEGRAGHGSAPLNADNALVKAANIVSRLHAHQPVVQISDSWCRFVAAQEQGWLKTSLMTSAWTLPAVTRRLAASSDMGTRKIAALAQSLTQMTISPNHVTGTEKANVVPGRAAVEVDVRGLPGQTYADVWAEMARCFGPLRALAPAELRNQYGGNLPDYLEGRENVVVRVLESDPKIKFFASRGLGGGEDDPFAGGNASSFDTPLWHAMEESARELMGEETQLVPLLLPGGTDARFFRLHPAGGTRGSYGAALFHPSEPFGEVMARFHGADERINVESIRLTANFYERSIRKLFSAAEQV